MTRPQVVNCDAGAFELEGESPTATPTATPTDGPTPTPTATEFAGTELIQNGGFENLGGDGKPDITPWIVKNSSGDKAKCNKDKDGDGIPDKIVANTGECAFQFKNVVGEAGKLEQTISLGSIIPTVGDTLTLNVAGKTTGGALGKVKVVVKYSDDTKTKITVDLDNPDAYAIESGNGTLTNTTIVKFKLSSKSSSTAGKIYVDDVSLIHESAASVIPVPPAELRSSK
jgi:hypothetical protein